MNISRLSNWFVRIAAISSFICIAVTTIDLLLLPIQSSRTPNVVTWLYIVSGVSVLGVCIAVMTALLQRKPQTKQPLSETAAGITRHDPDLLIDSYLNWLISVVLHTLGKSETDQEIVKPLVRLRTRHVFEKLSLQQKSALVHMLLETGLLGDKALVSLTAINLEGIYLNQITLNEAYFVGAGLSHAHFDHAKLHKGIFNTADLRNASFAHAYLEQAQFKGARLGHANFEFANLLRANMEWSDLRHATFQDAHMEGAYLEGCNLTLAVLRHAVLIGANLEQCNLEKADCSNADLSYSQLAWTNLQGAKLHNANLYNANLKQANLRGAQVTLQQLAQAYLDQQTIMPDGSNFQPGMLDQMFSQPAFATQPIRRKF
jgi:uncharacterized protein YjbI with pentapeptide repeats